MKPNTLIELADGRMGRVVYHGLDGYGIKFGEQPHIVTNLPEPDAMLRVPWLQQHLYEMVGLDWTVIEQGSFEEDQDDK